MSRNNSIDASVSNQPNSCCRSFNRYRIEENQKYKSKSTLRYDDFVAMANKIHQNKYDYSQVSFTRRKDKVNIVCPIHGVFTRTVGSHLRGSGCDLCDADAVYDLEKILHKSLANLKHEPNKCFEGRTECFKSITPILYLLDGIKIS